MNGMGRGIPYKGAQYAPQEGPALLTLKALVGPQTTEARGVYCKTYKAYQAGEISEEERCEARRTYYATIRRAKRECLEAFLQGKDEGSISEQKWCWASFRNV